MESEALKVNFKGDLWRGGGEVSWMHKAQSCPGAGLPCQQVSSLKQQTGVLQRLFEAEGEGLRTSDIRVEEEEAEHSKEKGPRGALGADTGNGWGSVGGRPMDRRPRNGWRWRRREGMCVTVSAEIAGNHGHRSPLIVFQNKSAASAAWQEPDSWRCLQIIDESKATGSAVCLLWQQVGKRWKSPLF